MAKNRKTPSQRDMLAMLADGRISFPPLKIEEIQIEPAPFVQSCGRERRSRPDALLTTRWQGKVYRFIVECKSPYNPKAIDDGVYQVLLASEALDLYPLLLVPYLSNQQLISLEQRGVSGFDLCGNGVITVPGEVLVMRSGEPNRFPREGRIKGVFRKNSAIVGRVFLLVPRFPSLQSIKEEIGRRGGGLSLATVSKVCATLDNELVVERSREAKTRLLSFRLLQPDKLLDLLADKYDPPVERRRLVGRSRLSSEEIIQQLTAWQKTGGGRVVMTGSGSTEYYAAMAREKKQVFYCTDIAGALQTLGPEFDETPRFANVEFIETDDTFVYFDTRDRLVASPIQTYVELTRGDRREQDTAEQVRRMISRGLDEWRNDDERV